MTDKVFETRLHEVIYEGQGVLISKPNSMFLDARQFAGWKARCLTLLESLVGSNGAYLTQFQQLVISAEALYVEYGLGILESAKNDVAAGYLIEYRTRVHAEVFSDFLDMADRLLADGYVDAAAVTAGVVLEGHLKNLCQKHGVSPGKAQQMNQDLAKQGVYSATDQKAVTNWLGSRNDAAHPPGGKLTQVQVQLMIQGVLDFTARHPA